MIERPLRRRTVAWVAGLACAGVLLAGCGDSSADESDAASDPNGAVSPTPSGMDDDMGDSRVLNDPDATPANELPDATEAAFVLLDTAPPGSDEVAGTAWVAFGEDPGTTLTVELTGLEPGAEYEGHLHAQACGEDNGGPHFMFDLDGSDLPPNEVHLGFSADAEGNGTATITNPQAAEAAPSVVIHPVVAMDNRLVCADL